MKYILLDAYNLFHRSKHVTRGDAYTKAGLSLHVILTSILKCWNKFQGDHVVIALEGKSWRRAVYEPYKLHRQVQDNLKSKREKEEDEIFFEVMNDFVEFVKTKTNCTVLQQGGLEADDLIARWTQVHPNDEHIIISSDSDFIQLLSDNVSIYNGIKGHTISINGVIDDNGKIVEDKKTKKPIVYNPEWELFKKCVKGDAGDGVFPAHVPRTRETKIRQAFEDMEKKGYDWNNLMLEEWEDHTGLKETVLYRYKRNYELICLSAQPDEIKQLADQTIEEARAKEHRSQIGIWFMKFCNKHDLVRIANNPKPYADILATGLT